MTGAVERVAIIGSAGEMGALFCERAAAAGHRVCALDQPLQPERVAGMDLVLLCVPIDAVAGVMVALQPHLSPHTMLADVCSVKTAPMAEMMAHFSGPVVGTHPLFGGRMPEPEARRVAVVSGRGEGAVEEVCARMTAMGFVPIETTAEQHDRAMAHIHALNFATTAAYLAAAAQTPGIQEFLTPSFQRRLVAAEKMITTDGEMFRSFVRSNPHSPDAIAAFLELVEAIGRGDSGPALEAARSWWSR